MALVVFTGGARSGKSSAAQSLAISRAADGHHVTVMVFGRDSEADPEFSDRIRRHRADRPATWTTVEVVSLSEPLNGIDTPGLLLVDCIGTLLGLAMEEAYAATSAGGLGSADPAALPEGFGESAESRFAPALEAILCREGDTIVVTNEVGGGIVPAFASSRWFRDRLGQANRTLVSEADSAYLTVAGRLIDLSSVSPEARWPED